MLESPSAASNGGLNSSLSVLAATEAAPVVSSSAPELSKRGKRRPEAPVPTEVPADDTVTLAAPPPAGESINVRFLFGIQKAGKFRFYVNLEALSWGGRASPPRCGRPRARG